MGNSPSSSKAPSPAHPSLSVVVRNNRRPASRTGSQGSQDSYSLEKTLKQSINSKISPIVRRDHRPQSLDADCDMEEIYSLFSEIREYSESQRFVQEFVDYHHMAKMARETKPGLYAQQKQQQRNLLWSLLYTTFLTSHWLETILSFTIKFTYFKAINYNFFTLSRRSVFSL